MKKNWPKIIAIIGCLIAIGLLIYSNTTISKYSFQRIVEESTMVEENNDLEEISEEISSEESMAETNEEETNSYTKKEVSIIIINTIIIVILLLTIIFLLLNIFGIFNKLTIKSLLICIFIMILLTTLLSIMNVFFLDKYLLNGTKINKEIDKINGEAIMSINSSKKDSALKINSESQNETIIKVFSGAVYQLDDAKLSKKLTSKENTTIEKNSLIHIKEASELIITNSELNTKSTNSSVLYSTGANTKTTLDTCEIKTEKSNSPALSIKNDSELVVTNTTIKTMDKASPAINTNAKISGSDLTIETNDSSSIDVIDNAKISLTNTTITYNSKEEKELSPINIIKENDLSESTIDIKESTITINKDSKNYLLAPVFSVVNTSSKINITNTKINYGSNILLKIVNDKEEITNNVLTITDEKIEGNIEIDKNSKLRINLNTSEYKGSINKDNISHKVDLSMDSNSYIILTDNSYVNIITTQKERIYTLTNHIKSNGHNIYYNKKNNEWLKGKTYKLNGGGKLIPINYED